MDRIQPSELQVLILAIALSPLMVWTFRSIELPGKAWLAAAITATTGSYICTVAEGFVAPYLLNVAEHTLYAISGACFTLVAVSLLKQALTVPPGDTR